MKRKIVLVLALTLFLGFVNLAFKVQNVVADARLPGVAPGQFLHYSINVTGSSNDTELVANMQQWQGWGNATVLSVSGVNLTLQKVFYNATTNQTVTATLNLESGDDTAQLSTFPIYFIAANLATGDPIYVGSGGTPPSFNETVPSNYLASNLRLITW